MQYDFGCRCFAAGATDIHKRFAVDRDQRLRNCSVRGPGVAKPRQVWPQVAWFLGMRQDGSPAKVELQRTSRRPAPRMQNEVEFVRCRALESRRTAPSVCRESSVSPRQVIHFIDESAAHSGERFFLCFPMNVHPVRQNCADRRASSASRLS